MLPQPEYKEAASARHDRHHLFYETRFIPGGCHVPSPGGKIDGGSVFGQ
jgi:hypothetical protein